MKNYTAVVVDKTGKKKTIIEESISSSLFQESLSSRGFFVIKIIEGKKEDDLFTFTKLTKKFILDFTYNVYSLLDFGIDINEVFRILTEIYKKGKESEFVEKIYSHLKKGEKVSVSLKIYEKEFGDFYITMINSGEMCGKLTDSFKLLFFYLKNNQKIKDKIVSASIYPITLMFVSFFALNLLLFFILPNFGMIYKNMDFLPPMLVGLMLGFSNFIIQYSFFYVLFLFMLILGLILLFRSKYSLKIKTYIYQNFPVLSKINNLQIKIKTSFSLEILLKSGANLEDALLQLSEIENNEYLKKEFRKSLNILKEGGNVKDAFLNIRAFDSRDLNLIEISESISRTKEGFEKVRLDAENVLENYLETIFKLIEPVMMIFIGIFIFFIMFLVISPTLGMLEKF